MKVIIRHKEYPIHNGFTIARGGTRLVQRVIEVVGELGQRRVRAEVVPYAHYGETEHGVRKELVGLARTRKRGRTSAIESDAKCDVDRGADRGADRDVDRGADRDVDRDVDRDANCEADRGADLDADRDADRGADLDADLLRYGDVVVDLAVDGSVAPPPLSPSIVSPSVALAIDSLAWYAAYGAQVGSAIATAIEQEQAKVNLPPKRGDAGSPSHRVHTVRRLPTAVTISLLPPGQVAAATRPLLDQGFRLLKLKVNEQEVLQRVEAVLQAVDGWVHAATADGGAPPDGLPVRLIVDANESWSPALLRTLAPLLADASSRSTYAKVALLEQPVAPADDAALAGYRSPIPLCADESFHTLDSLATLPPSVYATVNLKLGKTLGITGAIRAAVAAQAAGYSLMVGTSLSSSLHMVAAVHLAVALGVDLVDLDCPVLLQQDIDGGFTVDRGALVYPHEDRLIVCDQAADGTWLWD